MPAVVETAKQLDILRSLTPRAISTNHVLPLLV